MYGLHITLPFQAAAPGFFLRACARGIAAGLVREQDGAISALVPSTEPVYLETQRVNRWLKRPRRKGEYDQEWHPDDWAEFLRSVDRIPDTAGVFAFGAIDDPDEVPWLGFSAEYDTMPSDGPDVFHILQVRAYAAGQGTEALPAAVDPLALEPLVAAVAERFVCTYGSIVPDDPSITTRWSHRAGGHRRSLALSGEYLRGFEWLTYCPAHILDRTGGIEAARAGGAFHEVRQLPGGLVALQATPTPQEFDEPTQHRVQHALAAVLTPEVPTPGPESA